MVSKEEARRFLSKINPFVEKLPDITEKISKLEDDKEFQNLLGRLGTIGGLFNIGLYLFGKTLDHLEDTEKTYYSLINRTAISIAEQIIEQDNNTKSTTANEEKSKEILARMMRIYTFKETSKERYEKWNGLVPYDHPIIQDFKKEVIEIIKESNPESQNLNFVTEFDLKFNHKIKNDKEFSEYQKQKSLDSLSESRRAYYKWILEDLDKPNPVDNKRATDYYVKSRAIELETKDESSRRDYWNITDVESEEICRNKIQWEIKDYLKSTRDTIKLIAAPFGTGKTSFAKYTTKDIITRNLLGQSNEEGTWIPIYIPLNQNINSTYREGVDIVEDLNEIIKPDKENVLLICDGIDEYPDPSGIVALKDRLVKIRKDLDPGISISQLKIIFTTRLEAGLPEKLGIKKYVRLLPFTSKQVTEFFKRYDLKDMTFKDIRKYRLQDKDGSSHEIDLLKPLFCWMFALSYSHLQITKEMEVGISRLILYSTFIHSILEGRYYHTKSIAIEKWILRKIAALKSIFGEIFEEDLPKRLQSFIEKEQEEFIDLQNIKMNTVLASYFKLNKKGNNKHSVDFLHKSFHEYLLTEYYIESILFNKGFRLNIGKPSDITIEFLSDLISMVKDPDKEEYEKPLLRIVRPLYLNIADETDEKIKSLVKNLKFSLLDNAIKIFEENKIVYTDFENKAISSEYWKIKDIPNYDKYYENFIYKSISLFIIKKLDPKFDPKSIRYYMKGQHTIPRTLRYFPNVDLVGLNLSRADLSGAVLTGAKLYGADLSRADLSGAVLSEAKLAGANLSEAKLAGANLSRADLSYANLYKAVLTGANLSGAYILKADLSYANLYGAVLPATILTATILTATDLSRADLSGSYLSIANLSGAKLLRSDLSGAKLYGADLSGAVLTGAKLYGADLFRADLSGAVLTGAKLYGADLSGAYILKADLSGAVLTGAKLAGANLNGAIILKPINFTNLRIDDLTKFNDLLTDDAGFFNLFKPKVKSGNTPILVESKDDLIKELKKKSCTEEEIERFINQSKFSRSIN